MTYATRPDLVERYGTDEMAAFTDEAISAALADASTEMDASLGVRNALPLEGGQAASGMLKRLCAQLARFLLYTNDPPEQVTERAREARKQLAALAAGTMVLPGAEPGTTPTALAERAGPAPVMTPENLEGL